MSVYRYVFRGEVASKKNSKVLARVKGRPMLLPSRKYQEWEKRARLAIMAEGRPPEPLKAARLFMVIYHGDLIKRDSNNATQGVQDVIAYLLTNQLSLEPFLNLAKNETDFFPTNSCKNCP